MISIGSKAAMDRIRVVVMDRPLCGCRQTGARRDRYASKASSALAKLSTRMM